MSPEQPKDPSTIPLEHLRKFIAQAKRDIDNWCARTEYVNAAAVAAYELSEKIRDAVQNGEQVDPRLLSEGYFHRTKESRYRDNKRAQFPKARVSKGSRNYSDTGQLTIADKAQSLRDSRGYQVPRENFVINSGKGLGNKAEYGLWVENQSMSATSDGDNPADVCAIVLQQMFRVLSVMSQRDKRLRLEPDKVKAFQIFSYMGAPDKEFFYDIVEPWLQQGDLTLSWRQRLAIEWGQTQDAVTEALSMVEKYLYAGVYLSYVLAYPGNMVVEEKEMNELFDLVFVRNKQLDTDKRKLLELAGFALRLMPPAELRISSSFLEAARSLQRFKDKTNEELWDLLHEAESEYARLVPGQSDPPIFNCVKRCDNHYVGK